ncbi:hypothetical protein KOY49_00395 [Candidatus Minimicrobia vallesae]|uniref:Uncharacterized protein n=1 Tax=Candidatus Minimicrobia vallesae TaxID=2841264 RepID=A0A8F1M9X2_9BACT|nr:hypothetical protein [Candidatus Minimicrobia vallesae]QWQ31492.1 hypothetical protein KOY49_00395 [Candidatus Minimicrobia vallesae]
MDQLALAQKVTDDLIDNLIPLARTENVFDLFISALAGDYDKVHDIISYLESESGVDGAYQTMGLLASQATNLTALVLADGDSKCWWLRIFRLVRMFYENWRLQQKASIRKN